MSLRHVASFAILLAPLALACSAAPPATEGPGPEPEPAETTEEGLHTENYTYFIVTRPDYRKCMYPFCGGYYVKRVNRQLTQCADGWWATECHMADLDLSAIGVSPEEQHKFEYEVFNQGNGLVRGKMAKIGNADTLIASEAWAGNALSTPKGGFYRVTDSGLVCITHPCNSMTEGMLNTDLNRPLAELDLAASGANEKQVNAGYEAVWNDDGGVLVAGLHTTVKGPGGKGWKLNASEFYTKLEPQNFCATVYLAPPDTNSPTFYAKNFTSEKEAWGWLDAYWPNGVDKNVSAEACDAPRACIKIYKPVCGVVKYDPEQTYSNSCHFEAAVMGDAGSTGESKGYYTDGECGKPQCDYSDPNKSYISKDPTQCMAMKFLCAPGYQPFFDDCGCGCEPSAGVQCGNNVCGAGQVCCNASCGICTDPGMFCTQQACN